MTPAEAAEKTVADLRAKHGYEGAWPSIERLWLRAKRLADLTGVNGWADRATVYGLYMLGKYAKKPDGSFRTLAEIADELRKAEDA